MTYIAPYRMSDKCIQSVEAHLLEVRELAESFGEKIGIKHIAGLVGVLHGIGKYSDEFQDYILEAANNPEAPPKRGSVDHLTAGWDAWIEIVPSAPAPEHQRVAPRWGHGIPLVCEK